MKFYIKRLGCPKNDVDGDFLAGRLIDKGHEITFKEGQAELVIINTCGFILPAKEESIAEIMYYGGLKKENKIKRVYITGCLSQRYGRELFEQIPEVDGVFGLGEIEALALAIGDDRRVLSVSRENIRDVSFNPAVPRFIDNRKPYEYLKIAEGCDRRCSYCAIPDIRGRYRSRGMAEILAEARFLAAGGKKELILVSQEGTGYGRDWGGEGKILDLLKELEKIEGIAWIRLMYLHPQAVSDGLVDYMSSSEKVLGYFDIPLQHINDKILHDMGRPIRRVDIERLLAKIRAGSPKNIIRTSFIVGFPGEGEAEFEELYDFVGEFAFDRLGVFRYSPEEGTPAFSRKKKVPERLKEERYDRLMSRQQGIAFEKNIALIDTVQKVIIDEIRDDGPAMGRTSGDCPEIDQTVYVRSRGLKVGDIVPATVTMAEGYDLIATA